MDLEAADPASTLSLYRRAIALRRELRCGGTLTWIEIRSPEALHFSRRNGWQCITNFGSIPIPLPAGTVLLSSAPLHGDALPPSSTAWLR